MYKYRKANIPPTLRHCSREEVQRSFVINLLSCIHFAIFLYNVYNVFKHPIENHFTCIVLKNLRETKNISINYFFNSLIGQIFKDE